MKKNIIFSILFFFSLIVTGATEKNNKKENTEETTYNAKKIEYFTRKDIILLVGKAYAKHNNIIVKADTIEYNIKAKTVKAYGHPFLIDGKDTISGSIMVYNIETKKGLVTNGATRIEKGFFTGDTILKVGEKTLNVKKGYFTTCSDVPPHYRFFSERMKVYSNDMVVCEPVVLEIQEVPVFAVPFWFFPIKKGRHSGFLFPKVGKGSEEGRYIRNLSYFWALNDYSDITFTFDIFEKRGVRTYLDGRYIVTPFLSGNISGSYINDISTKSRRWNLYLNHKQALAKKLNLTAHADFLSDANYNVDYSEEQIVQLNKEIESYLSLTKIWTGASTNFLIDEKRDLSNNEITRRFPRITFSLSSRRIIPVKKEVSAKWYNQAYISYSSRFINKFYKDEDSTTTHYGIANNIKLQSPQKVFTYFNISPVLTIWENIYDEDIYGNLYPLRSYYSSSLSFSTVIYGISKWGVGSFKKFRHIIKPFVSYNYAPEEQEAWKFYNLEGMGVGHPVKNISFSLSNTIQAKIASTHIKKIDLINIKTSASYNFKNTQNPLSNISNSIEVEPVKQFSTRVTMSHNLYTKKLTRLTVKTSLHLRGNISAKEHYGNTETTERKMWKINLSHNYVKGIGENIDSQQLFGGINTWITKNWKMGFSTRYDFNEKRFINQSVSIYRDLHCWEAQFLWNSYGGKWKYDFKVNIKKIPEIKVTKGVFGIFIP